MMSLNPMVCHHWSWGISNDTGKGGRGSEGLVRALAHMRPCVHAWLLEMGSWWSGSSLEPSGFLWMKMRAGTKTIFQTGMNRQEGGVEPSGLSAHCLGDHPQQVSKARVSSST